MSRVASIRRWFVNILSCLALLSFSLYPCHCLAEKSISAPQDNQNPHSCCDEAETQDSRSKSDENCARCQSCIADSSCSFDFLHQQVSQSQLDLIADATPTWLVAILLPRVEKQLYTSTAALGPPGFDLVSSASLSTILHRWLV